MAPHDTRAPRCHRAITATPPVRPLYGGRRAGRTVIAGGPLFTTGHAEFPEIQHFVLGEAEEVMTRLVEDMRRGEVEAASDTPTVHRCDHGLSAACDGVHCGL